jgi:hypothetical protein
MAGIKADKLTKERRVEAVYRLILDGWTSEQIRANVRDWRLTDSQIRRYIAEAWERIEAVNEVELSEHKRRAVAAHYQMLREAKTIKDKLAIWAALSRLLGLDAPKAVEIGGPGGEALRVIIEYEDAGYTDNHPTPA